MMVPDTVYVLVGESGYYDDRYATVLDVTTTAIGAKKYANRLAGHELEWIRDGQGWYGANKGGETHTFTIEPWKVVAR